MQMASVQETEHTDAEFVRVRDVIPDILVELPYAAPDNFMGRAVYGFSDAWLRRGTAKKLAVVQETLRKQGLGLKIWDAFRPPAAQFVMWEVLPDDEFVANPHKGFSNHSRGNTVDVTLVDANGVELAMPTKFDDFSSRANRDYTGLDGEQRENVLLLEQTMEAAGFKPYFGEWWHFADQDSYPVEQSFLPEK